MTPQGYDLVGETHGHADPLRRMLDKLDYGEVEGVFGPGVTMPPAAAHAMSP